jgi:TPR repeat protein
MLAVSHLANEEIWWVQTGEAILPALDRFLSLTDVRPVIVLDDLQLHGADPSSGLTYHRLARLARSSRVIATIHGEDLARWSLLARDRSTRSAEENPPRADRGVSYDLVAWLEREAIEYQSTFDVSEKSAAELTLASATHHDRSSRWERLAESLAAVDQLAAKARTARDYESTLLRAAIDAVVAYPAGATLDELTLLSRSHRDHEYPNSPWDPTKQAAAIEWATTGINAGSPHAILQRNAGKQDIYRLLDALLPKLGQSGTVDSAALSPHGNFHVGMHVWERGAVGEDWLKESASAGNTQAMFNLAVMAYDSGDVTTAREWWTEAALNGHPTATFNLGGLAQEEGDRDAARRWFEQASQLNVPEAMYNLGHLLLESQELEKASALWSQAASLGHDGAEFALNRLKERQLAATEVPSKSEDSSRGWYLRGAAEGDAFSMLQLGTMAEDSGDLHAAVGWYGAAAELGVVAAIHCLGLLSLKERDLSGANYWLSQSAGAGNADAIYELAFIAKDAENPGRFEALIRLLAEAGHRGGLFQAGCLSYEQGDLEAARIEFERAADLGNTDALVNLGLMAREAGHINRAREYWRQAASRANVNAMLSLGEADYKSHDLKGARKWWLLAAHAGNPDAMFWLGYLAEDVGDLSESARWYRRSADLGTTAAMVNLASQYSVAGDIVSARRWWLRAADHSHPESMLNLGVAAHRAGDTRSARSWWNRAAEAGSSEAAQYLLQED